MENASFKTKSVAGATSSFCFTAKMKVSHGKTARRVSGRALMEKQPVIVPRGELLWPLTSKKTCPRMELSLV